MACALNTARRPVRSCEAHDRGGSVDPAVLSGVIGAHFGTQR